MMRTCWRVLLLLSLSTPAWAVGTATCTAIADFIPGGGSINCAYMHWAQCTTSGAYTAGGDQFGNVGRDLCGSANRLVKYVQVESIKATGATTAVGFDFIPSTSKLQCFFTPTAVTLPFAECTTQGQGVVVNIMACCA